MYRKSIIRQNGGRGRTLVRVGLAISDVIYLMPFGKAWTWKHPNLLWLRFKNPGKTPLHDEQILGPKGIILLGCFRATNSPIRKCCRWNGLTGNFIRRKK